MSADLVPVNGGLTAPDGVRVTSIVVAYDVLEDQWIARPMSNGTPVGRTVPISSRNLDILAERCTVKEKDGVFEYFPLEKR